MLLSIPRHQFCTFLGPDPPCQLDTFVHITFIEFEISASILNRSLQVTFAWYSMAAYSSLHLKSLLLGLKLCFNRCLMLAWCPGLRWYSCREDSDASGYSIVLIGCSRGTNCVQISCALKCYYCGSRCAQFLRLIWAHVLSHQAFGLSGVYSLLIVVPKHIN